MRVEPEKPIKLPGGSLTGPDKIATSGNAANRQEFESVRDTLDTLALNLTNYGHTWSPELRTAYENAIAFLSRAASEPKATVKTKPGETTVTVDFRGGAA